MIKEIFKSLVIGFISLFIINFVGQYFNFQIPINIWSVFLVGFLRVPGFIILLVILIL